MVVKTIYVRANTIRTVNVPVYGCSLSPSYGRQNRRVFLLICRGFGVKRNHRQQLLGIREHFLLNNRAQFFVTGPVRIPSAIIRSGAQHKVNDLVAEILRIADPRRFFDFLQLSVERFAVKQLPGIRVAILLILNPEICISDITVKNVLSIFRIGFKIGRLNLFTDKLGIFRNQITFQELQIAFCLLPGTARVLSVVPVRRTDEQGLPPLPRGQVKHHGRILNAKRVDRPFIPSSTPA